MKYKSFEAKLIFRVVLLLVTLSLPALVILKRLPELLVFLLPVIIFQVVELIKFLRQVQAEFNQFVESVHYRDFSRFFNEKHAPIQLEMLRKGFNEINSTLKAISTEKESQFQNLQKVMELVNTGIISYKMDTGEMVLMNEPLKKLLHLPFMQSIHYLAKRDPTLYEDVVHLQTGRSKIATANTAHFEKNSFKVLLAATAFQHEGEKYKLVAFQNVNEALDETEAQAWQKLLNVMTHEIMNSVAPISSLAQTLKARLQEIESRNPTPEDVEDMQVGIETIKRRSEGLLRFSETYRNLSKINQLRLETVSVQELLANLQQLMQPTLAQKNIRLVILVKDPALKVQADTNLLDQVLINLLVNAMEAVKDNPEPEIILAAYQDSEQRTVIKITDNGIGMSKEVQEKVFIPFFSTKKQGSGIGLSLCKQIVLLHKATIQLQSAEGEGTAFTLRFNKA
ncbi:HAMP domain-containing sensor histidine kinase [uncultured Pontibacter sp.]|uniref:sensor histidine kinase n=1 Tax=uncultured Pontibacter sp. TaxID=453356 RepID=UPI00262567BE|nr:HAMP domain-containing sensor histidine kinase [uncultured Pontibacter sp.]